MYKRLAISFKEDCSLDSVDGYAQWFDGQQLVHCFLSAILNKRISVAKPCCIEQCIWARLWKTGLWKRRYCENILE